jgi:hypothetical protein
VTTERHIATIAVLACAIVQAGDAHNVRAQQELFTCLLASARALPADELAKLIALVDAPVVALLKVDAGKEQSK